MNQQDIAKVISLRTGQNVSDVMKTLSSFVDIAQEELGKGGEIKIKGFGTFSTKERAARRARNMISGISIPVPPKTAPMFKASKVLKNKVEEGS